MDSYALFVITGILAATGVIIYRAALPKPLPGIPYDHTSASRLLGDVPDALSYHAETKEMMAFLVQKCKKLQSPIIQCFMRPFSSPWVVIVDSQEAMDIMSRRSHEFDRSQFLTDLVKAIIPHNQVTMRTGDAWRRNRKLLADMMSPSFLNIVAAPHVYQSTLGLLDLWKQKVHLSSHKAFDVTDDIHMCTVDTMWATIFGEDLQNCQSQARHLSEFYNGLGLKDEHDDIACIPKTPPSIEYATLETVNISSVISMNSPLGYTHHWLAMKLYPRLHRAMRLWRKLVRDRTERSWAKLDKGSRKASIESAVDLIVQQEVSIASKEGRQPRRESKIIRDEIGGLLVAGFETTATALNWGLKYLAKHQSVQSKLRDSLRQVFSDAVDEKRLPTAKAIAKARLPYLDAVIDEIIRCGAPIAACTRVATVDTTILGYHIPKGTDIFMLAMGPSINEDAMIINDSKRSSAFFQSDKDYKRWEQNDLQKFDPDRWLVEKNGELHYDSYAAPNIQFGAGQRSCFGKKLAYLELKIIFTLIIWSFKVLPPAEPLFDFKATDVMTHHPQNVLIRLAPIGSN